MASGAFLDLLGGTAFRSAMLALDLGIFERLREKSMNAVQIAAAIGNSPPAVERLLRYLTATGYLVIGPNECFTNSTLTSKWLLRDANTSMADFLTLWNGLLSRYWDRDFAESLRYGVPLLPFGEWLSSQPGGWDTFNSAMRKMARAPARELAKRVKLPRGARKLLDLGGNHGIYCEELCLRHGALEATVFDMKEALRSYHSERQPNITTIAGDVTTDDFGTGYDVILLSNLLHYFNALTCQDVLQRASNALREGGLLIINEQFAGSSRSPATNAFLRMVSLHYLLVLGSDAHPLPEVSQWVRAVGCDDLKSVRLKSSPGQQLLIAKKAGPAAAKDV